MKLSLLLILVSILGSSYGQDSEQQKVHSQNNLRENARQHLISQKIDSGVHYLASQNYKKADKYFEYAITNSSTIPSDLVFYFGKNSFFLNKYKQSIDWLSKYIQLKGTDGVFYDEAVLLLKNSESSLIDNQKNNNNPPKKLSSTDGVDCDKSGKVTCPVCHGSTVIVELDQLMQKTYNTCPYCNGTGLLSCDDYNSLIKGQLAKKINN